MILAKHGPSLAELREKVGTGRVITFNVNSPISMTVDAISAVGLHDIPIELPERRGEQASVWYVMGYARDGHNKDFYQASSPSWSTRRKATWSMQFSLSPQQRTHRQRLTLASCSRKHSKRFSWTRSSTTTPQPDRHLPGGSDA